MNEIGVAMRLVDGSELNLGQFASGKEFIHQMLGDDWGPPPLHLVIEGVSAGGSQVRIVMPYSGTESMTVFVDGKQV